MTVTLKSAKEIEIMRRAGRIVANALQEVRDHLEPGMSTRDLDQIAESSVRTQGGEPAFPHVNDFPGTACVCVNDEVVHGIPGPRQIKSGDIVKIDIGVIFRGYHGDAALTVPVGQVSDEAQALIDVTEAALYKGIQAAQPGVFLNEVGAAIEDFVTPYGFSIVRQYVGHGIGKRLHEDPNVAHFRQESRGPRLRPGMTFTIEPMINSGSFETRLLADDWTVVTDDGRLSSQFEHTVVITEQGPEILSVGDRGEMGSIPFSTTKRVQ